MTAEAVVAEPQIADIRESEDRIHRELQHYATKADKDTATRPAFKTWSCETQIKDAQMWLLLRLGGLSRRGHHRGCRPQAPRSGVGGRPHPLTP